MVPRTLLTLAILACMPGCANDLPTNGASVPLDVTGQHGKLHINLYKPVSPFRGLILFASGDGGWKPFEDNICRNLASGGFCVVGWDCRKYADDGPYDQQALVSDLSAALRTGAKAAGCSDGPLVLAGYSTGAEQAVAAAAYNPRLPGLKGLLIIAPGERGRYGITISDLMGLKPTGAGSFALTDFSAKLEGLNLFQIHGEHDPLAQTDWLEGLKNPHRLEIYPNGWHMFKGGPPDFQELVLRGANWVIDEPR